MFKLVNACYVSMLVVVTKCVVKESDVFSWDSSSISCNVSLSVGLLVCLSVWWSVCQQQFFWKCYAVSSVYKLLVLL